MFNNKLITELKLKIAVLEEREKLWQEKLEALSAKAEAKWEVECNHYCHTLSKEYLTAYADYAKHVIECYPEMPEVNIKK